MEKVGGGQGHAAAHNSSASHDRDPSSRSQYEAQQKMQRLRVASGAPFARGSATSMSTIQQHSHHKISEPNDGHNAYPADFRNHRNSSNVSRGGGPGRLSTGLTAAAAGSHHIHGSLPSAPLGKKPQHGSSASKSNSQMNGQIVN
jgi:hypothetical protein